MVLGCSFDTAEENAAFAKKFGFQYPLLCDVERRLGVAYGAADDVKASSARRVGVIIGPDGKVTHYFPKVKAADFPREALGLI